MSKKCITCWQYELCDPPKEVIPGGCEFYSPTRPTESSLPRELQADLVSMLAEISGLLTLSRKPR
jgi:hypothetical protein